MLGLYNFSAVIISINIQLPIARFKSQWDETSMSCIITPQLMKGRFVKKLLGSIYFEYLTCINSTLFNESYVHFSVLLIVPGKQSVCHAQYTFMLLA